jgi:hypothetical protein
MKCKLKSNLRRSGWIVAGLAVLAVGNFACGKKKDNKSGGGPMMGPGQIAIKPTVDLRDAYGLLVVDGESQSGSLHLMKEHNKTVNELGLDAPKFDGVDDMENGEGLSLAPMPYTLGGEPFSFPGIGLELADTGDSDSKMQKIDKNTGEIKDALTVPESDPQKGMPMKLPKISTIAVSDTKDIYLHFEQPFTYKTPEPGTDMGGDWMSSGNQCQVFKVKGGTLDQLMTQAPEAENLECIDNQHFINSWNQSSNQVFQFDKDGNVYYPGSIPNSPKTVVYKRLRDGSATTEMINAQICVQNFLVTKLGGMFYTGSTCEQGKGGGGGEGGFFRYIAPGASSQVMEIARDWWNFIFDTSIADTASGTQKDIAVFFGPYSNQGTTASWDSACLFKFDPSVATPTERVSNVITCGGQDDFWGWLNLQRKVDADLFGCGESYFGQNGGWGGNFQCTDTQKNLWKKSDYITEYRTRCESKDRVFAGGGSQINAIKQDTNGALYVIGAIRKKVEGQVSCNIEIRGPHCLIGSNPAVTGSDNAAYTSTTCQSAGGTWVDKGNCNGTNVTSDICIAERSWNNGTSTCHLGAGGTGTVVAGFDGQWSCENNSTTKNSTWQSDSVWYQNVTGDICYSADYATTQSAGSATPKVAEQTARDNFHDWNWSGNKVQFGGTVTTRYLVNGLSCNQKTQGASSGGNSSGGWTQEYKAMAKVVSDKKTLALLSLPNEQAIKLWIVDNKPYYSSYDTSLRQYLLNTIAEDNGQCIDITKTTQTDCQAASGTWQTKRRSCHKNSYVTQTTCEGASYVWRTRHPEIVLGNFEAYNVAPSGTAGSIYADGLDFAENKYKFGTVDVATGTLSLKAGLTGTIKTIVILPK